MSRSVQKAPYHAVTPSLVHVYRTGHPWVDRIRDQGGDRMVYRNMGGQTPLGGQVDSGHNNAPFPFLGSDSDRNRGHVGVDWGSDL